MLALVQLLAAPPERLHTEAMPTCSRGPKLPPPQVLTTPSAYLEVEVPRYEHAFVVLLSPAAAQGAMRQALAAQLAAAAQQVATVHDEWDILFAEALVEAESRLLPRIEEAGGAVCLFFSAGFHAPRSFDGDCTGRDAFFPWLQRTILHLDADDPRRFPRSPAADSTSAAAEIEGFDERLQAFVRATRDESYRAFNPSVSEDGETGEGWVAFRVSNNTRCSGVDIWAYTGLTQRLLSEVGLCRLDAEFSLPLTPSCRYVDVDFAMLAEGSAEEGGPWTESHGMITGFEDARLFRLDGRWAMLLTLPVHVWPAGASGTRVALALLDREMRVESGRLLSIDGPWYTPARFEKNWVPLVVSIGEAEGRPRDVLLLVYSFVPLVLIRPSLRDGRCTHVELVKRRGSLSIRPVQIEQSSAVGFGTGKFGTNLPLGGSQLIQVSDDRWRAFVHTRFDSFLGPIYNHHLVELARSPTVYGVQASPPFRLPFSNLTQAAKQSIQIVMGAAYRAESDEMIVSYGIGDCSAHLATISLRELGRFAQTRAA